MIIVGNSILVSLNPKKMLPEFTYSGNYQLKYEKLSNGDYNWEIAILSGNGDNLKFTRVVDSVDIFIVGGGNPGGNASGNIWGDGYYAQGGNGGNGGQCRTITNFSISKNVNYSLKIGASGQSTIGFGYTSIAGGGSSGGTGAFERQTPSARYAGTAGSNGVYAFGNSTTLFSSGTRYGAGGGSGGAININQGGSVGGAPGITGGGSGGTISHGDGYNAVANTGSGGGGGYAKFNNTGDYWAGSGGAGGSGIIIIRNHR